jgi:uncharacterized protein (DUF1800 family)
MSVAPVEEPVTAPRSATRGITRRQALAAAVLTGLGVGAIRLLGGSMQQIATPRTVSSSSGWVSPLASESARVMHLLRRTTLGYTPAQLETALSDGFNRTVDRLIETKPAEPPPFPAASTPGGRFAIAQLQQWWIDHMLTTSTPFAERMTLFWHGHFTSDYRKVADNTFIYWQNLTWRQMAMTDLRSMLMQVTVDPAMLRYLDLATSTGQSPNENYSRELMELFTMGAGNYTEDDVRESAKALAGWELPRPDSFETGAANRRLPVYSTQKTGVFNPRRAYHGSLTYLGKSGPLDTEGVLDRILAQPATATLIANKVAQHFVSTQPGADLLIRLADTFRRSKYDMKSLMRAALTSPEFTSDTGYRGLVKSPTEFMVGAARALGSSSPSKLIAASGSGMGQTLFDPPDVNGWPNNESWISSNTVVERVNFVTAAIAQHQDALPDGRGAAHTYLDGVVSAQTKNLLDQAADDRAVWFVALASPEFQLK